MPYRKGKKKRRALNDGEKKKTETDKVTWERGKNWSDIVKENDMFEKFYQEQKIVPMSEWADFLSALRQDLPSTFRITGTKRHAKDLMLCLKNKFLSDASKGDTANATPFLAPIQWYPDEMAWESKLSRKAIRKLPHHEDFHRFLITEQDCGAISRQEAVSMIPPLLLDVQSHHKVLDMCAAPGSKTAQIIETMHDRTASDELPSGLVIANDSDSKRCYMLVHQSKRLQTPCCMITNHDASLYPCIRQSNSDDGAVRQVFFDRILCDVPCSGDGTMRKNPLVWKKWTPHQGTSLHRLQMRILTRGLELLAVGGRLVYSTCSMNPLENEAVVATLLQQAQGAVRLVDTAHELPGLKRRKGLTHWKVFQNNGTEIDSLDAAASLDSCFKSTMFPPSAESAAALCLDRCLRIYPHDQDTGAFFVAVLEKDNKLPWQSAKIFDPLPSFKFLPWENVPDKKKPICLRDPAVHMPDENNDAVAKVNPNDDAGPSHVAQDDKSASVCSKPLDDKEVGESQTEDGQKATYETTALNRKEAGPPREPPYKKRKKSAFKEDPFIFIDENDEHFIQIKAQYDLSPSFPAHQLLIRCVDGTKRNLYFVSKSVRDVVDFNREKLQVVNTGVKVITRYSKSTAKLYDCDFRLTQEGLEVMARFLGDRRQVKLATVSDVSKVLKENEPFQQELSEDTRMRLADCPLGCVIFKYDMAASSSSADAPSAGLLLCGHKGKVSVRAMAAKCDRLHHLNVMGIEYEPGLLARHGNQKKAPAASDDSQALDDCALPGDEDNLEAEMENTGNDEMEAEA